MDEFVGHQRKKQVQFSENLTTYIDASVVEVEKDCLKRRKRLFRRALSFGAYKKKQVQDDLPFARVYTLEEVPSPKPILKKRSHYEEDFCIDVPDETSRSINSTTVSVERNVDLDSLDENFSDAFMEQILREGEQLADVYEGQATKDHTDKSVLFENRKNISRNKPIRRTVKPSGQDSKALLAKAGLVKEDNQQQKRELRKISCDCTTLQKKLDVINEPRMVRSPTFPSSPTLIPAVRHTLGDTSNLVNCDRNELRRTNNSWFLPEEVMHDEIENDENILNLWLTETTRKEQTKHDFSIDNAIFGSVKYLKARNIRSRCMSSETRI